jgi:hypothetical protein
MGPDVSFKQSVCHPINVAIWRHRLYIAVQDPALHAALQTRVAVMR